MTIQLRTDSDGNEFQVWAQRQMNSCAIASMWMARSLATRSTIAASEWEIAWRTFNHAVQGGNWDASGMPGPQSFFTSSNRADTNQSTMANMYGNYGTEVPQIITALRAQNLNVDSVGSFTMSNASPAPQRLDPSKIGDAKPAVCCVAWFNNGQRAGGHAIVAARQASSGNIVYLDPWNGVLVEMGNTGAYRSGSGGQGSILQILYVSA